MALTQALIDDIDTAFDINGDKQNIEIRNAFQALLDGGAGTASTYKAFVTQTSTNAPVEDDLDGNGTGTPFIDSIGGAWSYIGVGQYRYTKVGMFADVTKINVELANANGDQGNAVQVSCYRNDNDSLDLFVKTTTTIGGLLNNADGVLYKQGITIEVYP